ncbi:phosphoribosylamine--glycine ligase [Roseomonas nepalensis]|uniref:phosphoribosylamine--glycine ligase n=1 Tax=Muricoccus nepalensis TaxID=1854500 RepID=A0A502FTB2_9PROT|nr:phosphoribosylamine--glycine ligase [Roseomonas nepalensis]TPG52356.1 phosphoribosylamine--glycine ligase [Roseomonas nepalensis]
MRILAIGPRAYLGDIYLALQREGHEVRVHAEDPPGDRAFGGLIDTVPDWRAELDWVGRDGIVFFERIERGAVQDALRAQGYRVVGGSAFGDRLEGERDFGQAVLREAGLAIAESHPFEHPALALEWLGRNPGRYVLKHDEVGRNTFVGDHPEGLDLAFMLRRAGEGRVLLMERIEGVEVGVGAYFDGTAFLRPACIDFEHKRFFPGEMGEMTGEMGTLASYEGAEPLFAATLDRVAPRLAAAGHVGYVNLNLMVNERGVWPLEFTCRFGNPGFAVLAALQADGWGDLMARMAMPREPRRFATTPGWSVAIVLTVPPFPDHRATAEPSEDPPVFFLRPPEGAEQDSYHFVDMRREDGQLLGRRRSGHLMIVTGTGPTIEAAQAAARARAGNVVAPELRWRSDIGDRFLGGERERLRALGWLP